MNNVGGVETLQVGHEGLGIDLVDMGASKGRDSSRCHVEVACQGEGKDDGSRHTLDLGDMGAAFYATALNILGSLPAEGGFLCIAPVVHLVKLTHLVDQINLSL